MCWGNNNISLLVLRSLDYHHRCVCEILSQSEDKFYFVSSALPLRIGFTTSIVIIHCQFDTNLDHLERKPFNWRTAQIILLYEAFS